MVLLIHSNTDTDTSSSSSSSSSNNISGILQRTIRSQRSVSATDTETNDSTLAAIATSTTANSRTPLLVPFGRQRWWQQQQQRDRRRRPVNAIVLLVAAAAVSLTAWRLQTALSDERYPYDSTSLVMTAQVNATVNTGNDFNKAEEVEVTRFTSEETAALDDQTHATETPDSIPNTTNNESTPYTDSVAVTASTSSSSASPPVMAEVTVPPRSSPPPPRLQATLEPTMQPFTPLAAEPRPVIGAASTAVTTTSPTKSPTYPTSDWIETKLDQADDYPRYRSLSDLLQGPALSLPSVSNTHESNNGTTTSTKSLLLREAICQFRVVKYGKHFPHVMQQLYRCVSWWLAHRDVPAIFVTGPNTNWAQTTPFIQGFIQVLRIGLNLTVVPEYHSDTSHYIESQLDESNQTQQNNVTLLWSVESKDTGKWVGDTSLTDFALLDPQRSLLDFAMQYLQHEKRWNSSNDQADAVTCQTRTVNDTAASTPSHESRQRPTAPSPRIAILNRASHRRSLINAIELQTLLQTTFHQTVPIVTFDTRTNFPAQLSFFLQSDIVVTPHGAQLTGMAFLPRCASVLEIFPFRYLVPDYFGSLAAALEIQHGYVYMGNPEEVIPHGERYHYIRRFSKKEDNVNPDIDRVQKAVGDMVEHWKACVCNLASTSSETIMAQE